ncbi:MAG: HdeD family acid-resistance protein [Gammaproteobacteria bacterium]
MSENIQTQFLEDIKNNSGLTIGAGIIVLLMGLLAMTAPLVAGLSVAMMVGVILIIGGVGQLAFAFKTSKSVFTIIVGALTVIVGAYMVLNPGPALASLTIFLAAYLIVSGIFEALMAFQVKPVKGWGWALFSGILSLILGAMIWSQFPLSGAWAIGILIGVRLFFSGMSLLMFGLIARSATKELEAAA